MLAQVTWMGFHPMLPQYTKKRWNCIMLAFILKNRFVGKVCLTQKDFKISLTASAGYVV